MTRWIDMTDAQKGALHQGEEAKRRARIIANPASIKAQLAEIESEAQAIESKGGQYSAKQAARWREEKQPIFQMLARLNINPADIGIAA